MQGERKLSHFALVIKLMNLNKALFAYSTAPSEEERDKADREFADMYDWLVEQDIPIYFDECLNMWLYGSFSS